MKGETIFRAIEEGYSRLPRKGKPSTTEWTVLAGFVALVPSHRHRRAEGGATTTEEEEGGRGREEEGERCEVIAMGTGNKCAGTESRRRNLKGDVIFDSHAEVIARRSLKRFLMIEGTRVARDRSQESEFLEVVEGGGGGKQLRVRKGVKIVMFVSQTPCGDASIIVEPSGWQKKEGSPATKRRCQETSESPPQQQQVEATVAMTGAKRLSEKGKGREGGGMERIAAWEETGAVTGASRVKPGKGDPTASMSCSDKIAMWNSVGIEGALLARVIDGPIRISGIVIAATATTTTEREEGKADRKEINEEAIASAVRRAIRGRIEKEVPESREIEVEVIGGVEMPMRSRESGGGGGEGGSGSGGGKKKVPTASGTAINWNLEVGRRGGGEGEVTLSATGKKMGTTGGSWGNRKQRSRLSKVEMFRAFSECWAGLGRREIGRETEYRGAKEASERYQREKARIRERSLRPWIEKEHTEERFTLSCAFDDDSPAPSSSATAATATTSTTIITAKTAKEKVS